MSLLHQNPDGEQDDAARGEDLAKGTSPVLLAAVIAAVVVSIAVGFYFWSHRTRPFAQVEVVGFRVHPQHTVTPGHDANGEPMKQEQIDHVLLFARLRLSNLSDKPLFLMRLAVNVTLDDGIHTNYAASRGEYDRVFQAYPELAKARGTGLQTDATLAPGQTVEGEIATNFRLTQAQWDARKDLNVAVQFQYQPELVLPVTPQAVTLF